jgi:hypothetical protein
MEQVQTILCNSEPEILGSGHVCICRRLFAYDWPEKWAGAARWRYRMFRNSGRGFDWQAMHAENSWFGSGRIDHKLHGGFDSLGRTGVTQD